MYSSLPPCCNKRIKLCSNRRELQEDWISALPDVILVSVLSLLTTKEAGRTSVLSKRWRHVWAYVPLLIFDSFKIFENLYREYDNMVPETIRLRYLRCVDQALSSYKAPIVDEIRIRFLLGENSKDSIDKWVRFASEKKVKKLEFDFGSDSVGRVSPHYTFPSISLFNSLTSLQLEFVEVTGEVLERLIYNCKALEFLSVHQANELVTFKVCSSSLKFLRIRWCRMLRNLEISAKNLVSVDYYGHQLCMPFKNTPKLTELSVCCFGKPDLMLSPIIHQIEVLKLETVYFEPYSKVFQNATRVKTLDVWYGPDCDNDIFLVSSVIKACPLLHKLVLQIDLTGFEKNGRKWEMDREEEPWCLYNLKFVEIVGFAGLALQFVRYLIKKFVSLEKLIIDTQPPFDSRGPHYPVDKKKMKRAQKQAEKLRSILKPETQLEIL